MTKPITHRPLKKSGPKPIEPPAFASPWPVETDAPAPEDAAELIRAYAADGWSKLGIAHGLGVNPRTLNRWLEDHPELSDAIALGREQEHHALYNMLFVEAVEKKNITAALAILNARHGWRGDQSGNANGVNLTIALPGAMTMQQFTSLGKGD